MPNGRAHLARLTDGSHRLACARALHVPLVNVRWSHPADWTPPGIVQPTGERHREPDPVRAACAAWTAWAGSTDARDSITRWLASAALDAPAPDMVIATMRELLARVAVDHCSARSPAVAACSVALDALEREATGRERRSGTQGIKERVTLHGRTTWAER